MSKAKNTARLTNLVRNLIILFLEDCGPSYAKNRVRISIVKTGLTPSAAARRVNQLTPSLGIIDSMRALRLSCQFAQAMMT
jgi:hypothetical protein